MDPGILSYKINATELRKGWHKREEKKMKGNMMKISSDSYETEKD